MSLTSFLGVKCKNGDKFPGLNQAEISNDQMQVILKHIFIRTQKLKNKHDTHKKNFCSAGFPLSKEHMSLIRC